MAQAVAMECMDDDRNTGQESCRPAKTTRHGGMRVDDVRPDFVELAPKAPHRRIEGTLVRSPGWVIIKTPDGKDEAYEVRPYIQERLTKSPEGGSVILMIDDENKVSDLAVMNQG